MLLGVVGMLGPNCNGAHPGAKTRVRTMRQGLGRRMATPPRGPPLSPSRAGEEATAVSSITPEIHKASTLPVQRVSWSSTGLPTARAFSISSFLFLAR
eukprot:8858553-Lingulodinium_polyedra.AAC.1